MNITYIIGLLIVFFILGYFSRAKKSIAVEHFESGVQLKECNEPKTIYDTFYSNLYDELFRSKAREQFEALQIREVCMKSYDGKIKILDIGCGMGHTCDLFNQYKYNVVGLDISPKMLEKAKINYPLLEFVEGDMTRPDNFEPKSFTHVTCLFYSIYYCDNIHQVFENVNQWLVPEGYFTIHIVDKRKFDPVLERSSSLIPLYNPQRFGRKTQTTLKFSDFNYKADWNLEGTPTRFTEIFTFNNNKVRKNNHSLYIYTMKKFVDTAENTGFKLINTTDMAIVNHPYNYLFTFQKRFG